MASMPIPPGLGGSAESVDTHTSLDLWLSTWSAEIDHRYRCIIPLHIFRCRQNCHRCLENVSYSLKIDEVVVIVRWETRVEGLKAPLPGGLGCQDRGSACFVCSSHHKDDESGWHGMASHDGSPWKATQAGPLEAEESTAVMLAEIFDQGNNDPAAQNQPGRRRERSQEVYIGPSPGIPIPRWQTDNHKCLGREPASRPATLVAPS
ncbi:hypothetical protein BT67DRAFT_436025 [Trichocladium antarcticum]|uniref:Uncharacterized protein n=1 Tax=Trichocladium antarcticum TaxID=1450529 RepID=A0AAN6UFZ1_9PEZI|nr:hypothetical protein BT67DRAFT_436025 [Trichocladium antarcticum]